MLIVTDRKVDCYPKPQCWVRALHEDPFLMPCDVLVVPADHSGLANIGTLGGVAEVGCWDPYWENEPMSCERGSPPAPGETRLYRSPKSQHGGFANLLIVGDDGVMPLAELVRAALAAVNATDFGRPRLHVAMPPFRRTSTGGRHANMGDRSPQAEAWATGIAGGIARFLETTHPYKWHIRQIDVASFTDHAHIGRLQEHELFR